MDDDELRRGRPTCHVAYGEDVAILAGDGLFAEAFRLVLDQPARASRRACSRRCASSSAAIGVERDGGRAVRGRDRDRRLDEGGLRHLHALKTGALIARLHRVPTCSWGPTKLTQWRFRRFAAELGVLFQIVDDILDVTG